MRMQNKRDFYIPENAQKIAMKSGGAVFYCYTDNGGRPCAVCFVGRAQKPTWRYYFRNPEVRAERIAKQIASVQDREIRKAKQRAERNKPHNWETGLILFGSWGYEQTNIDFFEVTRVIGKTMVEIEEIGSSQATDSPEYGHGMANHVVPDPKVRSGKFSRVRVSQGSIKSPVYGAAWPWDGKPKYSSWYA
ncbi:hypothetical protein [Marinovum algicola]|uniref:hypothetical protein n=1 Tax=Marinovum algicola TaxID=42444 RepID=UPI003B520E59